MSCLWRRCIQVQWNIYCKTKCAETRLHWSERCKRSTFDSQFWWVYKCAIRGPTTCSVRWTLWTGNVSYLCISGLYITAQNLSFIFSTKYNALHITIYEVIRTERVKSYRLSLTEPPELSFLKTEFYCFHHLSIYEGGKFYLWGGRVV